jgi:hypothetical protein
VVVVLRLLLISVVLLVQVGFSQGSPSGVPVRLPDLLFLDFVEWDFMPDVAPGPVPCLDGSGLPALCLPIVHLFDDSKTTACMLAGVDVECSDSFQTIFLPVDVTARALQELQAAERRLIRRIALVVDRAINDRSLPPCHSPTVCLLGSPLPVPDIPCLLPRVFGAVASALANPLVLGRYYVEVEGILNLWLPNHVRSGAVWPAVASVVSPTMSGVGDLLGDIQEVIEDIQGISDLDDALSRAYRLQALFSYVTGAPAPVLNFLPSDFEYRSVLGTDVRWPGIYDYELDKFSEDDLLVGAVLGDLRSRLVNALPVPPWVAGVADWLVGQVLDDVVGEVVVGEGALRISNPFLYEFIGYAGFLQVRPEGGLRPVVAPNGLNVPLPSIRVFCGLWPLGGLSPIRLLPPVVVPVYIPGLASSSYITVAEGYPVPHTSLPIVPSLLGIALPVGGGP